MALGCCLVDDARKCLINPTPSSQCTHVCSVCLSLTLSLSLFLLFPACASLCLLSYGCCLPACRPTPVFASKSLASHATHASSSCSNSRVSVAAGCFFGCRQREVFCRLPATRLACSASSQGKQAETSRAQAQAEAQARSQSCSAKRGCAGHTSGLTWSVQPLCHCRRLPYVRLCGFIQADASAAGPPRAPSSPSVV